MSPLQRQEGREILTSMRWKSCRSVTFELSLPGVEKKTLIGCRGRAEQSRLKERNKGKEVWEGWGSRYWPTRAGAACGVCRREHESKNVQPAWAWTLCWGWLLVVLPMRSQWELGGGVLGRITRSICVLEKSSDSRRKDGLKCVVTGGLAEGAWCCPGERWGTSKLGWGKEERKGTLER